jgi:GNAT superfamily N-acetyltransferase
LAASSLPHITTRPSIAYEAAQLRSAGLRDVPQLTRLYQQAWPEHAETQASVQAWLEQGGALVLEHAEAGGCIVCAVRWREEDEGWRVDRVATLPEFRGQNFGRWLMTKVEALAIQRNVPRLVLQLDENRDDLVHYYGRMGYKPVETEGDKVVFAKRVGGTWQYKER